MKHARVLAYGIIPIDRSKQTPHVLLVEQYSAEGTHWGFPKGKGLDGEQPLTAAQRELHEETGLVVGQVIENAPFTVNYSFTYEDTIVDKTVTYFIGFVDQPGLALRENEIKDAQWCSFEEAHTKLTFSNIKDMFDSIVTYMNEQKLI